MAGLVRTAAALVLLGFGSPPEAGAGVFPASAFSDKAAGTTAAAFLKQLPGARALALGGSAVAAADNSEAIFWNPAGLARLQGAGLSEASFSYNSLLQTSYGGGAAYARPFPAARGVLGASVVYYSQKAIQGFTATGDPNGSFTPNDLAVSAAYAWKFPSFSVGGAVKLIRSQVADASGTGFAVDLGVQAQRVTDVGEGPLDVGFGIQNFGPPLAVGSVSDPLPFQFTGGMLWHVSPSVNALLDGHAPVDSDPYATLGAEFNTRLADSFKGSLRAGFNMRNTKDLSGFTGVSMGAGMDFRGLRLDYAWVPFGDLGDTHRVSLGLRF